MQINRPNIQVIAVPALDFDSVDISALQKIATTLTSGMLITKPLFIKKSAGILQDPLFYWLTHKEGNTHFDADIENEVQLFIISRFGTLYSVLQKNTPKTLISQGISQPVSE